MGLAHMFLFLYKHNPMCSIYTNDLPYSFFYFNTPARFRSVSGEILATSPAKVRWRLRRRSCGGSDESTPATPVKVWWGGDWKIPMNSGFTNKN